MSRGLAEHPLRRLLLAGSFGAERIPARPEPAQPRWFEALHVRDEASAHARLASQVAAGADVIVAPTWLTHRRALLAVGETRHARAWTVAAIRVARQAVEMGLERREQALATMADHGADAEMWQSRPTPLVAASLPALDEGPEPGTGRLLPREAATERDYRDQAGLLADAEPDLILVEGQGSLAEVRRAVAEAAATGLPTWLALSGLGREGAADDPVPDETTLDLVREAGIALCLMPPPPRPLPTVSDVGWGGLLGPAGPDADVAMRDAASDWLASGASAIGVLDGASPRRLQPIRDAVDDHERVEVEAAQARERRWWAHVLRAASMAPGGVALWLASELRRGPAIGPASAASGASAGPAAAPAVASPLPAGFEWVVVGHDDARGLPEGHFRLIVDPVGGGAATALWGRLLEHGGIVALPLAAASPGPGLRTLILDDSQAPPLAILRREA